MPLKIIRDGVSTEFFLTCFTPGLPRSVDGHFDGLGVGGHLRW